MNARPCPADALQTADAHGRTSVHPEDFYERQRITLLTGTEVVRIDAGRRIARLADGRDLPYSRCLLATGGRARELPGLPRGTPGVHYIRTLDDAALRAGLAPQTRVAVIGGGFLPGSGVHRACAGAEVTVLESAPRLLERVLPEALSDWLAERARHAGVDLRLGARIAGCDRQPQADAAVRRQARFSFAGCRHRGGRHRGGGHRPDARGVAGSPGRPGAGPANGGIAVNAAAAAAIPICTPPAIAPASIAPASAWRCGWNPGRTPMNRRAHAAAGMLGQPAPAEPYPWF